MNGDPESSTFTEAWDDHPYLLGSVGQWVIAVEYPHLLLVDILMLDDRLTHSIFRHFLFFVNASLADEQPHFLINRITFLGGCTLLKGEPGVSPAEGDPGEINRQVCKPVKGKKDWQGWWKLMSGRIRAFVEVSANIWVVLGEWYAKKGLKSCHQ